IGCLLVGDRDVAASETLRAQVAQECRDLVRLHRALRVAAVDAVFLQPVAMDDGRARMGDRPADDARLDFAQTHWPITPRDLSSASRGSSGRPMMVKLSPSVRSNS